MLGDEVEEENGETEEEADFVSEACVGVDVVDVETKIEVVVDFAVMLNERLTETVSDMFPATVRRK